MIKMKITYDPKADAISIKFQLYFLYKAENYKVVAGSSGYLS